MGFRRGSSGITHSATILSNASISSVNATDYLHPNLAGYCASKAAIIQMTKALVGELGDAGI